MRAMGPGKVSAATLGKVKAYRDNMTREVAAARRGETSAAEHRRAVRSAPRAGGLTQYQREERGRASKIRRETGFPTRYQRDQARIIAEANGWASFRLATAESGRQMDAHLAALFVDNFTVGKPLTTKREGKRDAFIASVDVWSWRVWRNEYDRHNPGSIEIVHDTRDPEQFILGRLA